MSVTFYARKGGAERPLPLEGPNFHNGGAAALLRLLGFQDAPYGEVTIGAARRAVTYARATFPVVAPTLEVAPSEVGRVISFGMDTESIRARLTRFEWFLEAAERANADVITWG